MSENNRSLISTELETIPREWPIFAERLPLGRISISDHEIGTTTETTHSPVETIAGRVLISEDGIPRATMSFVGYRSLDQSTVSEERPLVVGFNGGPISSGVGWFGNEGYNPILHDNVGSQGVINFADAVYMDPVGTGYGRVLEGTSEDHFYGVEADALVAAEFVKWYRGNFTSNSPIIMAGSSNGAFRMTAMANRLAESDVELAGLISISGAYDYNLLIPNETSKRHGRLLSACNIPSFADLASYHSEDKELDNGVYRGLPPGDRVFMNEIAQEFAWGPYADAMLKDRRLSLSEQGRLSELTGLSLRTLQEHDFAVSRQVFSTKLLNREGLILSSVDGAFTYPATRKFDIDPLLDHLKAQRDESTRERFWMVEQPPERYVFNRSVYGQWPFDGEYRDRSIKPAMQRLLKRLPGLPVVEFNGATDLLSNKDIRDLFWESALPEIGWKSNSVNDSLVLPYKAPDDRTVDQYTLEVGHQPAIFGYGRNVFSKVVQAMVASP